MKKGIYKILCFIILISSFSFVTFADINNYNMRIREVKKIVEEMNNSLNKVKNIELPELDNKVEEVSADLQEIIDTQQDKIDYYKEKFDGEEEAFETAVAEYRRNISLNKKLIKLLTEYRNQGISKNNPAGRILINELEEEYQDENFIDSKPLEILAGIYWYNFKLKKISELINLAETNLVKGISEEDWLSLNMDYDKRYRKEVYDPGEYWGVRPTISIEKELYSALYQLGREYELLNESDGNQPIEKDSNTSGDNLTEVDEIDNDIVISESNPAETEDETDTVQLENNNTAKNENESDTVISTENSTDSNPETIVDDIIRNSRELYNKIYISSCRGAFVMPGSEHEKKVGTAIYNPDGFQLQSDDRIVCGQNGYVTIKFEDADNNPGSDEIRIWPGSEIVVGKGLNFNLIKGFMHIISKKKSEQLSLDMEDNIYHIESPSTTIGFRGSNMITYVDKNNNSVLFLQEGNIAVSDKADGQIVKMNDGQLLVIFADGQIDQVKDMSDKDRVLFNLNIEKSLTADTVDPLYLENGLYYTWYEVYEMKNNYPANTAEMDKYFSWENNNIAFRNNGIFKDDINWTEVNKPYYLPDNYYSFILEGYIYIPVDGVYTFALDSGNPSDLIIDNRPILTCYDINNKSSDVELNVETELNIGYHPIQVRMKDGYGGEGLRLLWKKPDDNTFKVISASNFFIDKGLINNINE